MFLYIHTVLRNTLMHGYYTAITFKIAILGENLFYREIAFPPAISARPNQPTSYYTPANIIYIKHNCKTDRR